MKTTLNKLLGLKFLSLCITALLFSFTASAQQPAASLEQGRNGNYTAPLDPIAWVNGNLNSQQAHMIEGYSVPYRVIMTNLVVGVPVELEIQYDTRHSSKHSLDFITYYDNMEPHWIWGHSAPTIDPLLGYPAVPSTPAYATIPAPTQGILVNGILEPQTTFNNLPANLKRMTLFGGTFAAVNPISYSAEDPIGAGAPAQTSTTVLIKFTPSSSTAILAWGGHIATSITFGDGESAGGINGSPYHTRLIDWNLNNLGNQDRSLSAASVVQLPECDFSFTPSSPVCINTPMSFTIDNPHTYSTYAWNVTNNGTNASPVNGTGTSLNLNSGTLAGSFTVEVTSTVMFAGNPLTATCSTVVDVNSINLNTSKVDIACFGGSNGSVDLSVIGGSAPFTYSWVASNGGVVPVGQSGNEDLTGLVAGTYSVTVTDFSGCSAMTSVTILQPTAALSTSASKVDVLCYGLSTGSIDLSVNGGTAPYSYAWSASLGGVVPVGQSGLQDLSGLVAGTYSVVVTDANGCVANESVVITEPAAALVCSVDEPGAAVICNTTGNILTAVVNGGTGAYSYSWSVSSPAWVITSGQGTASIEYTAGGGIDALTFFTLTVTDANGCISVCSVEVACTTPDPEPEDEYCSLTQGFYGNMGGTHCDNRGTLQLIDDLLLANGGSLIAGIPANNKSLTLSAAQDIISILPGGGPASALNNNYTFANISPLLSKQGKLRNILLAQTITLQLNVWLDADLGGLVFTGPDFYTLESTSCGDETGEPVPGTEQYYSFPSSVYNYILLNYPAVTVDAILDLANKALGGVAGLPSLSDIAAAADMINVAFDECRWLEFGAAPVIARMAAPVEPTRDMQITVNMAPNPFSVSTHITFTLSKDSKTVVEVYDMLGSRIATLFEGDVKAGQEETILYTAPSNLRANTLMVIVRTAEGFESKRMILTR
ncbi:MAG: hypothetical protein R6V49_10425 [Bacteroidales bacterium]